MTNDIEVLVVDDVSDAAREFARLITTMTGFNAAYADGLDGAREILSTNPVQVVVLDQKMGDTTGTGMFAQLKAIDANVKVLMFSGQAETEELALAHRLGFDDYLNKTRLRELPQKVQELVTKYEIDKVKRLNIGQSPLLLEERVGFWPFQHRVRYHLLDAAILATDYVLPDSWSTVKQVNAGETSRHTTTITRETKLKLENSSEQKLSSSVGFTYETFAKLESKLNSEISEKTANTQESRAEARIEVVRELKLPDAPTDPSSVHLACRHYQEAPVYSLVRVNILKRCTCCGTNEVFVLRLLQTSGKVATRHKDYWSDKTEHIVPTGIEILKSGG